LDFLCLAVAFPDHLDVMLTRLDTAPGFLLKGVKHVDAPGKSHRIDGPIRVALEVVHDLQDASASKPFEGLGAGMLLSELGKIQGEAHHSLHLRRKLLQVVPRRTYPDNPFEAFAHPSIMPEQAFVVEGRGGVGRVDLTGEEYSPCRQGYMPGSSVLLVNVRYAGSETLPSVEEVRQQIGEGEEVEGVVVEDGERREGSEDKRDECNSDVASQCLLSWR